MAIDKIFSDKTVDGIADNLFNSVSNSVSEVKAMQQRKAAENVQLVIQALKKIDADLREKYEGVATVLEKRVSTIKDGRDGISGSDGRDGKLGKDGRPGRDGKDGLQGRGGVDGTDGENGVSVTDAHIDFDGSLIISLSSGQVLNVGEVVAPDLAEKIKVITNGGGTSQQVLDTLISLQTQINNIYPSQTGNAGKFLTTNGTTVSWSQVAGGLDYQGTWNASANTPTLASGVGINGYYYITDTAGSTNLDGITDWQIGDWLLFNGTVWQKIDQSNTVVSVNGQVGIVVLSTTDVGEGSRLYYTDARARAAISAGTGISYSSATGVVTNSAPDQTVALTQGGTTTITGTYPNFTISSGDQFSGTVTSVAGTGSVNGISLSGTVTSSGSLTLGGTLSGVSLTTQVSGTLPVANGGTGATTAPTALTNLGAYPSSNPNGYTTNTGTVTSVATGTGLSGGPVTSAGTISLANTAVTPGSYTATNITVDAQGRITAAASGVSGAAFLKTDPATVAFTKTGAGTATIKAGTIVEVVGSIITYASATTVVMPTLVIGTDYAVYAATDGTCRADSSFTAPLGYSTANTRRIGGFHYAAGDNAAARAGGNTTANINAFSFYDLKFKPSCGDARGMTLVAGAFWSDIYMCGVDHQTNGTSRYNVSIADGVSAPKLPTAFGGNGSLTYTQLTWWNGSEILRAYGKRLPSYDQFAALAYGSTEAISSGGSDVPTTGVNATGFTSAWNVFTSKWGVIQATGNMWTWGDEFGGGAGAAAWTANTGGRGQTFQLENAMLFGGRWDDGAVAGSRSSRSDAPTSSAAIFGVRGVADHLILE